MELYIGGTAQGKKAYVTQVRGIEEARIWDNFEEWFLDKNKDPFAPNLDFRAAMDAFEEGGF